MTFDADSKTPILEFIFSEAIFEPPRPYGPSALSMNLVPNGGIENIRKILSHASPSERDYWGKWYTHAQDDIAAIAEANGKPFELVAAVVAVLSPGTTWKASLTIADRLLKDPTQHASSFPGNLEKARLLIHNEGTVQEVVVGPKVCLFYQSLVDPESTKDEVVVDGHAINVWKGAIRRIRRVKVNVEELNKIKEDYRQVAKENGLTPQGLQAIIWYIWKSALKNKNESIVIDATTSTPANDVFPSNHGVHSKHYGNS